MLQPGETLGAVASGDTARWVIGDTTSGAGETKRSHFLVKPFFGRARDEPSDNHGQAELSHCAGQHAGNATVVSLAVALRRLDDRRPGARLQLTPTPIAAHIRQQAAIRDESRTRDNLIYAFGSIVERGGYLELDDYAIAGLEHHGDLYALWLSQAALLNAAARTRGDLLRIVFADLERLTWCRAEGARLAWEHAAHAREADTAQFLERQARGGRAYWRKEPVTARQTYMMTLISVRGGFAIPSGLRRGTAHDWIAANGGHPNFWTPPEAPPRWVVR
jgi:hypothetical protein